MTRPVCRLLNPRWQWKVMRWREDAGEFLRRLGEGFGGSGGRKPHKTCPRCNTFMDRSERACPSCGYRFGFLDSSGLGQFIQAYQQGRISAAQLILGASIIMYCVSLAMSGTAALSMNGGLFGLLGPDGRTLFRLGAVDTFNIIFHGHYWRMVTGVFLHAGLLHIFFNMLILVQVGPLVENALGRQKFVVIYVVAGFAGFAANVLISLLAILASSQMSGRVCPYRTIGASGAIFGLVGACIAYGLLRRDHMGKQLASSMFKWVLIVLVLGFLMPGINNVAHVGGGLAGAGIVLVAGTRIPHRGWSKKIWNAAEVSAILVTVVCFVLMIFLGG